MAIVKQSELESYLLRLKGNLRTIFDAEMEAGNSIIEIDDSWPQSNVNIWLKNPINPKFQDLFSDIEYTLLNDPHYWLEEYVDRKRESMLAAKFQSI